jgi:glucose-1-phosphate adenylyltransferase
VPAQQRLGKQWFLGSADAIFQSMNLIIDDEPDIIVVFGADHVYRMDAAQMVAAHIECGAGATVAGIRVPRAEASAFGVIATEADGVSIAEFLEKPDDPPGLADSPDEVFASMGNYVFSTDALVEALKKDAEDPASRHDMGGDIIPMLVGRGEAGVYDFRRNDVPGSTEKDRDYWRDVGTLSSYHEAHLDLVSVEPVFNLYNSQWPIFTAHIQQPGAKFVEHASANDAIICAGSIVSGAKISKSVIGNNVYVSTDAELDSSVIMDNVKIGPGAMLRNTIIDKNVVVPDKARIGYDAEADRAAGFTVTDEGITVLGKGQRIEGSYTGPPLRP